MNKLKRYYRELISIYTKVVTGVSFATALYITIFWGTDTQLKVKILWQILGVSAICCIGSLMILVDDEKVTKRALIIRKIIYFIYTNIVVLGSGVIFQWFYLSKWRMLAGMELMIVIVFLIVLILEYQSESKVAEKMNQILEKRNRNRS